jgi:hypothetical protein
MSNEVELAMEYRKHAKALRAAAAFEEDANTSALLKKIANRYEDTANELEGEDGISKAASDPHRTAFATTSKPGDGHAT